MASYCQPYVSFKVWEGVAKGSEHSCDGCKAHSSRNKETRVVNEFSFILFVFFGSRMTSSNHRGRISRHAHTHEGDENMKIAK